MKVLHLSDTTLSGAPYRISSLLTKYKACESKHLVWHRTFGYRTFPVDLCSDNTTAEEARYLIYEWADVIHFHNRWRRQEVFKALGTPPPKKPSVIQMHSNRDCEPFDDEFASGLPLAVVAQYHPRQYPELKYIVPNVVDIFDPFYMSSKPTYISLGAPLVSYAPSSVYSKGWGDKGYSKVTPIIKKIRGGGKLRWQFIMEKPFEDVMELKRMADIGIDDIVTGSYHLSALEYLSVSAPCFDYTDALTEKVVKDLTGCEKLPFLNYKPESLDRVLRQIIRNKEWVELGKEARGWMEKFWNPDVLCKHYMDMYKTLV